MAETPFYHRTSRARKVTCRVCGRTGWGKENPTMKEAAPWQRSCLGGHPFRCSCGKQLSSRSAVAGHLRLSDGSHVEIA